jgi:hypothetical protein
MVSGTRVNAQALRQVAAGRLAPMDCGSRSTRRVVDIDEDFDFLGWRIRRKPKRGTDYPGTKIPMPWTSTSSTTAQLVEGRMQ